MPKLQAIEQEEVVESAPASLCKEDATTDKSMRVKFEAAVRRAQDDICKAVSDLDGKQFHEDAWTRPGGGGGVSRVLQASVTAPVEAQLAQPCLTSSCSTIDVTACCWLSMAVIVMHSGCPCNALRQEKCCSLCIMLRAKLHIAG